MHCPHHIWITKTCASEDYCKGKEQDAWEKSWSWISHCVRKQGRRQRAKPFRHQSLLHGKAEKSEPREEILKRKKAEALLLSCKMMKKHRLNLTSPFQYWDGLLYQLLSWNQSSALTSSLIWTKAPWAPCHTILHSLGSGSFILMVLRTSQNYISAPVTKANTHSRKWHQRLIKMVNLIESINWL